MTDYETAFRSLDGTALFGTVTPSPTPPAALAVLAHGAGVTREEGGFFTRLTAGLASTGITCLRFDLRAHGASAGRFSDVTIAGVANDIRAASDHLLQVAGRPGPVHVISASFSGGASALHAGSRPGDVAKLVLLNPRMDYQNRFITETAGWNENYLSPERATKLDERGFSVHQPFETGRGLLNEVFHLDPEKLCANVKAPVLIVHGTKDTFVDIELSRRFRPLFGAGAELYELEGAQHGFAVHDDPTYAHPQSQAWQREVIAKVSDFLAS
ncbi:alpha-beta hydrolase superfamily lysophospholipase [Kitasatospora sp. MAP12-15]|uniref:alpha/beta hydrolase n=1 Tax=unclassified Kitasatospora TaxID=2633591 RepID=UPI00247333A8|nr:alpha/beta fold hydrolase [Kitasatospora sp. MAP12-44]MDH6110193.1 alpha-beta hydrolase superfamily lysophospholipase [Kitasatospora sp. MAP12-44]